MPMILLKRSFLVLLYFAIREVEGKIRVLAVGVCFEGLSLVQLCKAVV
jgi:hypothetical protein